MSRKKIGKPKAITLTPDQEKWLAALQLEFDDDSFCAAIRRAITIAQWCHNGECCNSKRRCLKTTSNGYGKD